MPRHRLVAAFAALAISCSGAAGFAPVGDLRSSAAIRFSPDATVTSGAILAFDPARHSMEIEVAMPIEQRDDIDVYIITANGIRFQILSSFQGCRVDGAWRRCDRQLPVLPDEGLDNWRVEAERDAADGPSPVQVDVTWVPLSG